jgi:hypothetical protein
MSATRERHGRMLTAWDRDVGTEGVDL